MYVLAMYLDVTYICKYICVCVYVCIYDGIYEDSKNKRDYRRGSTQFFFFEMYFA